MPLNRALTQLQDGAKETPPPTPRVKLVLEDPETVMEVCRLEKAEAEAAQAEKRAAGNGFFSKGAVAATAVALVAYTLSDLLL